ncbi:tRNA (guanosine(37)-N1)-methyltransferase TrmD [Lentisphaerota bacterium WC36G]|nr:tRNA (guanosine(37)-N1)-methyltransferase TrmD [Lentisphaerae bacterium WC36]
MKIDILTLFPNSFFGPFAESIVKRAIDGNFVEINAVNLRDYSHDKRGTVDDKPYGGGPGMLLKAEPLTEAIEDIKREDTIVILTTPQGEVFDQKKALELSKAKHLVFVCGHYEGVDERIRETLIDYELSIGDYVLTSGNLPAMVMSDAIIRLLPGVLGDDESSVDESFSDNLLEYPQYTRPEEYRGMKVPEVLLSGNHKKIAEWRKEQSLARTKLVRPELLEKRKIES